MREGTTSMRISVREKWITNIIPINTIMEEPFPAVVTRPNPFVQTDSMQDDVGNNEQEADKLKP